MPLTASFYVPAVPKSLVVISHGSGGRPRTHQHLAEMLCERGYLVAVPEHKGNHRGDNSLAKSLANCEMRPRRVSDVIDACYAEYGALETVVIGHSLGGYTALILAGAGANVMGNGLAGLPRCTCERTGIDGALFVVVQGVWRTRRYKGPGAGF